MLTSQRAEAAAKRMRRTPTAAERRLWKVLRGLDLNGSHFRRQVPLGPYVVDFACHAARLAIEVDGGVHRLPDVAEADLRRQSWLEGQGWTVLRVASDDAYDHPALVSRILSASRVSPAAL